jgi:hypothetical protein
MTVPLKHMHQERRRCNRLMQMLHRPLRPVLLFHSGAIGEHDSSARLTKRASVP